MFFWKVRGTAGLCRSAAKFLRHAVRSHEERQLLKPWTILMNPSAITDEQIKTIDMITYLKLATQAWLTVNESYWRTVSLISLVWRCFLCFACLNEDLCFCPLLLTLGEVKCNCSRMAMDIWCPLVYCELCSGTVMTQPPCFSLLE